MFLSKDGAREITKSELFEEYSSIVTHAGNGAMLGERILRSREIIFGKCNDCGKELSSKYSTVKERDEYLCQGCRVKRTKLDRYGTANYNNYSKLEKTKLEKYGHPRFCNKKKAMETCERRYGVRVVVPKGINKGIKRTQEQKDNVSRKNKIFYSDKTNHPAFGKSPSEESREKSRQTHLKNIANGYRPPGNPKTYVTGKYYSEKTNKTIKYRSSYEKWFFYMLENNIEVKDYKVEHLSIPYNFKNKSRLYIPDVFVEFENGSKFLIEIKPSAFLNKDINLAKWKSTKDWCSHNSTEFIVLTEQDMLTFILKTTSVEGILAYPEEWKQFIFKYTRKLANKFIENEVQNG